MKKCIFSEKIHSLQFFDSIVVINIAAKILCESKICDNNKDGEFYYADGGYAMDASSYFNYEKPTIPSGNFYYFYINR